MHYVSRGEGKPLLFLHGFPQFWFLWREQLADLGNDHAVYAPDMRGYNLSCKPEDPEAYRMRHLLRDVVVLVEELDLAPLTLVGHDWGGIVSWAFALKHPEMLERLVIIDAPRPSPGTATCGRARSSAMPSTTWSSSRSPHRSLRRCWPRTTTR